MTDQNRGCLIVALSDVLRRWRDVMQNPTRTALLNLQVALDDARDAARDARLSTSASEEEMADEEERP